MHSARGTTEAHKCGIRELALGTLVTGESGPNNMHICNLHFNFSFQTGLCKSTYGKALPSVWTQSARRL